MFRGLALAIGMAAKMGCADCWESPMRSASVSLTLAGGETSTAGTRFGVRVGTAAGCDETFASHDDANPYELTPLTDADVRFGPADGELIVAAPGEAAGRYIVEQQMPFVQVYRFTVDDELLDLDAPRYFTASLAGVPPTVMLVETRGPDDLGGEIGTSIVVYAPDGTRGPGESHVGTSFTLDARHFTRGPGVYRIELGRSELTLHPNDDWALYSGTVHLTRVVELQVN